MHNLARQANNLTNQISQALQGFKNSLDKYLGWLKVIPPMQVITAIIDVVNIFVKVLNQAVQAVLNLIPKIIAPWTIRSIGNQMVDGLDHKIEVWTDDLVPSNLKSERSWRSTAAESFRISASDQHDDGAEIVLEKAKAFSKAVKDLGDKAVNATIAFVSEVLVGFVSIADAGSGLADAIFKAAGAALKGAVLAAKILSLVVAVVKFAMSVSSSANGFIASATDHFPAWPDGATP